ncbi:MAG: Transcriptional regulator, LysR family [Burkholderiaceae bacterium]|jgi:DNA-binding transcriptional LysR family regulator|nr:MAG: Transcriptional regulator, LysR family [Burkholderiaceae bacterium]
MDSPNFRTLDLNLLRVFDEVMTERSLTRAARNLSLTQPAVSNALRRLREALGDELVRRGGQGMEPTPRARALWPAVRDALRQLQASLAPSAFVPADADNSFVLAMADATGAELIPHLAETLENEAPGVSLRVVPLLTRDPRRLLDDESADLAVGYFPAVLADLTARAQVGKAVAFAHEPLYEGRYVCVMRQSHPLAAQSLTLARFCGARHLLVSFSGEPFGFTDQALTALGRERRVVLTVNQFYTAGQVVSRSNLLTVLPQHFVPLIGFGGELVQRELPFEVPAVRVTALWHRRVEYSGAHRWLRQAVAGAAHEAFAAAPRA